MTTRSTKQPGASPQSDPVAPGGGHAAGTDTNGGGKSHLTDLELMMCFDGELDEAQRHDVLAAATTDLAGRTKLAALHIVSEVLRDQASAGPGGDIADLVMARIAAEEGKPPSSAGPEAGESPAETGAPSGRLPIHSPPANDNARGIFALAAIAVAAAAALMVWGRMDPEATRPDAPPPVAAVATTPAPAVELPAPSVQAVEEATPDGEDEHGVEVAAVDFGTRTGTIFYVPMDAASQHTTTVVWLADDLVGGK